MVWRLFFQLGAEIVDRIGSWHCFGRCNVCHVAVFRLASTYGSERSAPFVNGLAEALAKTLRPGDAATECG